MEIIGHTVEKLNDPTGILEGERYEFFLELDVPEEDELFSEKGVQIKVIYAVDNKGSRIAQAYFLEKGTAKFLDFELEEDELEMVNDYCKDNLDVDEENE